MTFLVSGMASESFTVSLYFWEEPAVLLCQIRKTGNQEPFLRIKTCGSETNCNITGCCEEKGSHWSIFLTLSTFIVKKKTKIKEK